MGRLRVRLPEELDVVGTETTEEDGETAEGGSTPLLVAWMRCLTGD
jgi:hypothetical protein